MDIGGNRRYLNFLEGEIMAQKKNGGYFPSEMKVSYRADVQALLQNILKKHPGLAGTANDIDADPRKLPLITSKTLLEYLKASKRGAACYYRDDNGVTRIMVNAGPGYGTEKNRVLFFPESLKNERPEEFRRILRRELVKQDIEHAYRELRKRQQRIRAQNKSPVIYSRKKSADRASSAFEAKFKELVKSQGAGISPMKAAQSLVLSMPGGERSRLNSAFKRMNIKNGAELEGLLAQWKYEALGQTVSVTRKQEREAARERA